MNIYFCYENNCGDLLCELNCVEESDMAFYRNTENAIKHIREKIVVGMKDGYVPEDGVAYSNDAIKRSLQEFGKFYITMFYEKQENDSNCYEIIVLKKELI